MAEPYLSIEYENHTLVFTPNGSPRLIAAGWRVCEVDCLLHMEGTLVVGDDQSMLPIRFAGIDAIGAPFGLVMRRTKDGREISGQAVLEDYGPLRNWQEKIPEQFGCKSLFGAKIKNVGAMAFEGGDEEIVRFSHVI